MEPKVELDKNKIVPERMAALRALPIEIKQQLSGEEARAFLYGEDLPDDLAEKLKDFIVDK